jgi:urease accessory protein
MLVAADKISDAGIVDTTITLPFETRQKSRLQAVMSNGEEIGLLLPRGTVLRDGDILKTETGLTIKVQAAEESVSSAHVADPVLFARACYHLGNRHVPLQIGNDWLRYLHDHVLDDMLRGLGISPQHEHTSFEPEAGAYGGGHHHHHDHEHP